MCRFQFGKGLRRPHLRGHTIIIISAATTNSIYNLCMSRQKIVRNKIVYINEKREDELKVGQRIAKIRNVMGDTQGIYTEMYLYLFGMVSKVQIREAIIITKI